MSSDSVSIHQGNNWKGDKVGYDGLHWWIRKHLPKSKSCQDCDLNPPREVANITGDYNRNFINWKWLCIKCHRIRDQLIDMSKRRCSICNSNKTMLSIRNDRPVWYYSKITSKILCHKCYLREHRNVF